MNEIWIDVPEYEGLYKASNLGRVKSLQRYVDRGKHKMFLKEKIINSKTERDYLVTALSKDGESKTVAVHSIIAMTFMNHKTDGYDFVVDHIDGNKYNNSVSNLQIVTQRENVSKRTDISKTSRYVGVCWTKHNKKWRASIRINGKPKHLGYFTNEEQASEVYQKELKNL
jgi:hypothetical protein